MCARFPTGERTWGIGLSPDETRLYAASGLSGTLTIIDLVRNKVMKTVTLGGRPWGAIAARNEGAAVLVAALLLGSCNLVQPKVLTACADPNNLPFSNKAGQGFENRLAEMIAPDLHAKLDYVWWAQRRGYVRNTLNERACDLWPGSAAMSTGSPPAGLIIARPNVRQPRERRARRA